MSWAGHHLFREAAVVKWAQSEPLDALAQVNLPHERAVAAALTVGIVAFALWCALGSIERNLWLAGTCVAAGPDAATVTLRLSAEDAGRLSMGARGAIVDPEGRAPPAAGAVAEVSTPGGGAASAEVVWRVAEPGVWRAAGEACGLRLPMGRSRPAQVLLDVLR